jgi:hypothetical protein
MGMPDSPMLPRLADLRMIPDGELIRKWLAARGFVAVERNLMADLVGVAGITCGAVYNPDGDYYIKREKAA